jgi:hypothetical protein
VQAVGRREVSHFFEKASVNRVRPRICILIVRFWRSTWDAQILADDYVRTVGRLAPSSCSGIGGESKRSLFSYQRTFSGTTVYCVAGERDL